MLTYDIAGCKGPLYQRLYECVKEDIEAGRLRADEKMPSKRSLSGNLGVSTITVENAYDQLISEGYMYAIPKKGYFVAALSGLNKVMPMGRVERNITIPAKENAWFDFSSNRTEPDHFPFSIWARVMRETISMREKDLLETSPCGGVMELRQAISEYLSSFRGMAVDPDQIIVGAGTEYLYGLLVQLLGRDKVYCTENPGYRKLRQIYESNGVLCRYAGLDSQGIIVSELREAGADVAHISPAHHFPTGILMPASRRYELLAWANENEGRYIIEDDYDSEFRLKGSPLPTLQSIDACGKVIYMNTFSKSLTATIRISYMVLPEDLANRFYRDLSFYSCTVSTFEQYALAAFISQGYFEKHINRMRRYYGRKRAKVLETIRKRLAEDQCTIIENDAGLHFILQLATTLPDQEVVRRLAEQGIKIATVTDYETGDPVRDLHQFIINYSGMDMQRLEDALEILKEYGTY